MACNGAMGPRGSHQRAASRSNLAISEPIAVPPPPPAAVAPAMPHLSVVPAPVRRRRVAVRREGRYLCALYLQRRPATATARRARARAGRRRRDTMARIVMKFGGTSVADLDRIRTVAGRVKREVEAGNEVAVVVSAMAGATNGLVRWCQELSPLHDAREYDTVVATGEQVTSGLLAIALQAAGVEARSWQGWQVPVRTDGAHGKARVE